ncbi:MAG: hypothetical protein ACLTSG_02940 [Lachnospiraceae bacterium]
MPLIRKTHRDTRLEVTVEVKDHAAASALRRTPAHRLSRKLPTACGWPRSDAEGKPAELVFYL